MYKLEINGSFRGNFQTVAEAMAEVEKSARPFGDHWVIYDTFGSVFARG
jgi:hypothetical protein